MSDPCKKCGSTDFTPSGGCRACNKVRNAAYAAKKAGGGSVIPKAAKATKASTPPATPALQLPAPLTLEPGYGFTAVIHDGYLQIEQSDEEGKKDTLMLSRYEARRLFEEFELWANA